MRARRSSAAQRAFDPRPLAGVELCRPRRRAWRAAPGAAPRRGASIGASASRGRSAVSSRPGLSGPRGAFLAEALVDAAARARSCSSTATRKSSTGPSGLPRRRRGDAARPALARAGRRRHGAPAQGGLRLVVVAQQVAQAALPGRGRAGRAPPARGSSGAARRPRRRTERGEGAVGGVEQVVALVEDDALQRVVSPSAFGPRGPGAVEGGLGQHQGVVGDDDVGPARARGSPSSTKQVR